MNQQEASAEILNQLVEATSQLDNEEFFRPLEILSGNTIGKHIRHIIEFYDCLLHGYSSGIVDYDKRAHNPLIENNKLMAIDEMKKIITAVEMVEDKAMVLEINYGSGRSVANHTSFNRELIYNIEHAIHHMAIIKIAMAASFPGLRVPKNFGVAYSTVKFREEQCAQ